MWKLILSVVVLLVLHTEGKIRYDGYKVYRFTPNSAEQVEALLQLENMGGVSFWQGPFKDTGKSSDVMIPPHLQGDLLDGLRSSGMMTEEYIDNVQRLIDAETVVDLQNGQMDWTSYHTLADIYSWVEAQAEAHSDIASTWVLGRTYEGRELKAIKISKSGETKPAIFLDSNIHAREWITSAVSTYLINELLNGNDTDIQSWLNDFDWYILPVFNPDGFQYSHVTDRMWRKTRSNSTNPSCKGVDPNRNFDYFWFTGGSSSNPCSETHAGTRAFSEPETYAMSLFIDQIAHRMPLYLSLHSYGQWILIPHGHNNNRIPQYQTYMRIGQAAATAHAQRYGSQYVPGNVVDLLYVASGESFDWVKGKHNTNLTYIYELRDKGRYGFVLPPDQIVPTALEFLDGLKVIINEVRVGIPPVDPREDAVPMPTNKLPPQFVQPVLVPEKVKLPLPLPYARNQNE